MPCYLPLEAYNAPGGISFRRDESFGTRIQLPCGRCLGCRLARAKEWALRCHHESEIQKEDGLPSSFITLTYRDESLPKNSNLTHEHFQKFIKSYKKRTGKNCRYFMCGEYGSKNNRPHYHAILFGVHFSDRQLVQTRDGIRVYTSELLAKCWPHGSHEIGSVTFQSAGYVARYILKKQQGDADELFERYALIDPATGEMTSRTLEYTRMSLKPGIGKLWYDTYKNDLFPQDIAITPDGREMPVPKYYRELLKKDDPKLYEQLRKTRLEKARDNPDNTPERLAVRHLCRQAKTQNLKRELK